MSARAGIYQNQTRRPNESEKEKSALSVLDRSESRARFQRRAPIRYLEKHAFIPSQQALAGKASAAVESSSLRRRRRGKNGGGGFSQTYGASGLELIERVGHVGLWRKTWNVCNESSLYKKQGQETTRGNSKTKPKCKVGRRDFL